MSDQEFDHTQTGFDFSEIRHGRVETSIKRVELPSIIPTIDAQLRSSTTMRGASGTQTQAHEVSFRQIGTSLLRPNPHVKLKSFGLYGYSFDDPSRIFR